MMDNLVDLFAPAVALATVLASIAIWAPRKAWIKVGAVAAAALFMPLAYTAFAGLLGKPKPVQLEWVLRTAPEATVIAASVHEGEAIFLWLRLDDVAEPRAYALPWSRAVAEQLQAAQREAEHNRERRAHDDALRDGHGRRRAQILCGAAARIARQGPGRRRPGGFRAPRRLNPPFDRS